VLELTTTDTDWPVIDTPPLNAACSTGSSAACTTACRPTSSTPRSGRSWLPLHLPLDS
jgi:hypothetical protein